MGYGRQKDQYKSGSLPCNQPTDSKGAGLLQACSCPKVATVLRPAKQGAHSVFETSVQSCFCLSH